MFNIWITLISMAVSVVLGAIWYGPLFGKKWMALTGIVMPDKKPSLTDMLRPIGLSMLGAIFVSYVLTSLVVFHNAYYSTSGTKTAIALAVFVWLGTIVPAILNFTAWEGKPWTLFWINAGYWLIFLSIVAGVVSLFV